MSKINNINLRHLEKRINFVLKPKWAEICFKACLNILLCHSCCEKKNLQNHGKRIVKTIINLHTKSEHETN